MKKIFRRLAAGAIVGAMLCTSAGAISAQKIEGGTITESNGSYTVTVTNDAIIDGQQYVLLILRGTEESMGSISEVTSQNLTYINQDAAKASGHTVEFKNFRPSSVPNSIVLLGGSFSNGVNSPVLLGAIDSKGITANATINIPGNSSETRKDNVSLNVMLQDGSSISGSVQPDGSLSIEGSLEPGKTYELRVTKPGYIGSAVTISMDAQGNATISGEITLRGGDVNNSGAITVEDIADIIKDWKKSASECGDRFSDVNESGSVTPEDLGIILTNYRAKESWR